MAEINKITGIVVGEYGNAIPLTVVDNSGNAIDISSYTAISITAKSPFDLSSLTFVGSFVTSGVDGKIQFTPTISNTFDRPGDWKGQIVLTATNIEAKTVPFTFHIEDSLT